MIIKAYGSPAPQGSKRLINRGNASGRPGVIIDANPRTATWRSDVISAARQAIDWHAAYRNLHELIEPEPWVPIQGAVVARMVFSVSRPKSVNRRKRPFPSTSPDLSKLCRATEDALKAAGVYHDDALIVEYTRLAKVYCNEDDEALEVPGCWIVIRELFPLEELG